MPVHDVALVEDQLSVTGDPTEVLDLVRSILTVGTGPATIVDPPPPPHATSVVTTVADIKYLNFNKKPHLFVTVAVFYSNSN
jgi:hypothetical protein